MCFPRFSAPLIVLGYVVGNWILMAGVAIGFVLAIGNTALAAPAVGFASPTLDFDNFTDLVGWQFTANSSLTVDALGFYDNPANGIGLSHDVGIYDCGTEALVLSGVVSPADPYNEWFNWASISPGALEAGHTYDIVTILGSDNRTWNPIGFTVDPDISYIHDVYSNGVSSLAFPNSNDGLPNGFFGPNFDIAVPEPAGLSLLALGGLAMLRRRK
jgi:hypothetical protein